MSDSTVGIVSVIDGLDTKPVFVYYVLQEAQMTANRNVAKQTYLEFYMNTGYKYSGREFAKRTSCSGDEWGAFCFGSACCF